MSFVESLKLGFARRISQDVNRSRTLDVAAKCAIESAENMIITKVSSASVVRESYEALRMMCEAIGYIKGFKFNSHEVIVEFLRDELNEKLISVKFDFYRKLRNGANYYGSEIAIEDAIECRQEIRVMILSLEKYL